MPAYEKWAAGEPELLYTVTTTIDPIDPAAPPVVKVILERQTLEPKRRKYVTGGNVWFPEGGIATEALPGTPYTFIWEDAPNASKILAIDWMEIDKPAFETKTLSVGFGFNLDPSVKRPLGLTGSISYTATFGKPDDVIGTYTLLRGDPDLTLYTNGNMRFRLHWR